MSANQGRDWSPDNWCRKIIQPVIPGVPAYRCHNNGIHDGLCKVHRQQEDKRLAKQQP
jgi:hypothetical protein